MGSAGYKNCCAFFLIWGYFIIHQVLFRPWGSLHYQKKALPKKHYATTGRNFFFSTQTGHPCYQSPEPSRSYPASLSVCATLGPLCPPPPDRVKCNLSPVIALEPTLTPIRSVLLLEHNQGVEPCQYYHHKPTSI